MKKSLVILSSCVPFLLAGCSFTQTPQDVIVDTGVIQTGVIQTGVIQTGVTSEITWATLNGETSNSITYTNKAYWFSLQFPASWKWYIATTTWNTMRFWFNQQSFLFGISAISHNEWNNMQNDLMHPTYLWENTNYVFVYETAQDAINQNIADRMWEINAIVKTFKAQ